MLRLLLVTLLICGAFHKGGADCESPSATTVSGTHAPRGKICSGDLIFEDNFDMLDLQIWEHELTLGGGGNWEFEWYNNNRSNSYVDKSVLHIKPTLLADDVGEKFLTHGQLDINGGSPADACTNPQWYGCVRQGTPDNILNPIKSARMRTVNSFSFKYGKVEVRAKLPAGDWLWPASLLIFGTLQEGKADCDAPSVTTVSGTHAPQGKICPGDLIFEDNFNELNLQKWQHELTLGGGGNWEFEWYNNNRTNSYVQDGVFHIKPTLLADEAGEDFLYSGQLDINGGSPADRCTNPQFYGCLRQGTAENVLNPIKSARIRTVDTFAFSYGKVEFRAKLPAGDWLWPALWLLPRWNQYAGWPASGEIDVMESRGNRELFNAAGQNIGTHQVGHTLHFGPNYNYNRWSYTHFEKNNNAGYDKEFHTYGLDWTKDHLSFYVDSELVGTVTPPEGGFWELGELQNTGIENPWQRSSKMAPFDQEFYIIINLAVGGTSYFPDDCNNPGGKPWLNSSPRACGDFWEGRNQWLPTWNLGTDDSHFQIDYVRVWAA